MQEKINNLLFEGLEFSIIPHSKDLAHKRTIIISDIIKKNGGIYYDIKKGKKFFFQN
jgi:hypothetical protein